MAIIKVNRVQVLPNVTTLLVDENENVVVHFLSNTVGVGVLPDLSNPANRVAVVPAGTEIRLPANKSLYCYYQGPVGASPLDVGLIVVSTVG